MGLFAASACDLPPEALLAAYAEDPDNYTDCFAVEVQGNVSLADFIAAFYTTWLFKLERWLLSFALGARATDQDARNLAEGQTERYSAWTVEARTDSQIVMCPVGEKTRSWFMVEPLDGTTTLYFGSAVLGTKPGHRTSRTSALLIKLLLPFHRLYSLALLSAARRKLPR